MKRYHRTFVLKTIHFFDYSVHTGVHLVLVSVRYFSFSDILVINKKVTEWTTCDFEVSSFLQVGEPD